MAVHQLRPREHNSPTLLQSIPLSSTVGHSISNYFVYHYIVYHGCSTLYAFVGVAEELCDRTSGKVGTPISRNHGWWTEQVAKAVGEKREAWKMIEEGVRDRGEQPPTGLRHLYGQKKKAARRAVDRARRSMEEELYRKLDEDGGKNMIFKMARDRNEDGRDVKRGAVIKDNYGRLITESKEVLRIWAVHYKELLNGKGAASCLELPSSVRREVELEEIGQEEVDGPDSADMEE